MSAALARAFERAQQLQRRMRRADAPTPRALRLVMADQAAPPPRNLRAEVLDEFPPAARRLARDA